jgi:hypothetical protein
MIRLYRPSVSVRATVDQQARIVLPADTAPTEKLGNHYRVVTLLIPSSPEIHIGIDQKIQDKFGQSGIGPNRTFQTPVMPGGQVIQIRLMDHQHLIAMAKIGKADLTILCEYVEDI